MKIIIPMVLTTSLLLGLSACSEQQQNRQTQLQAVKIETSDECHLCGMIISEFPGPKGELYRNDVSPEESRQVKKFCSTRDLFSFYLDPENKRNISQIFVHDMSRSPWSKPNDEHFIDAKNAWFVVGSEKKGAMGMTLASFATEQHAKSFANEFGGKVINFSQVSIQTLME